MNRKVRVLQRAQTDLIEIRDYVRRDRPVAAERLIEALISAIDSLAAMPDKGCVPRDPVLRIREYRVLIVADYLIFYKTLPRQVRVYRVVHGRRRYRHLV